MIKELQTKFISNFLYILSNSFLLGPTALFHICLDLFLPLAPCLLTNSQFFRSFCLDHDKDNINDENGVDIEHDDDQPLMGDLDGMDHDPNDMSRPRKIRR